MNILKNIQYDVTFYINLLKHTDYMMHQVWHSISNALPSLYLCVLYLSENKQRLMPHRS